MKVLVTGGAGFIGSHTVDLLIEKGYDVVILDNLEPQVHGNKEPDYLNKEAKFIRGDVRNPEDWLNALDGCDAIIHLASMVGMGQSMYQPVRYLDINTLGTAMMFQTIMQKRIPIDKIVVASSISIYGEGAYNCINHGATHPHVRTEQQLKNKKWEHACQHCNELLESAPTPEAKPLQNLSTYAVSKHAQEIISINYGIALGTPTVALRYFNTYGPRQSLNNPYTGVAAIFSSRIKNNNPPLIFEDGLQKRDFIHVKDIAAANLAALEKAEKTDVYNAGLNDPVTILDLAKMLIKLHASTVEPNITNQFRKGDIRHCYADIAKIKKELGWKPKIDIKSGLKDLVEWSFEQEAEDKFEQAHKELQSFGMIT